MEWERREADGCPNAAREFRRAGGPRRVVEIAKLNARLLDAPVRVGAPMIGGQKAGRRKPSPPNLRGSQPNNAPPPHLRSLPGPRRDRPRIRTSRPLDLGRYAYNIVSRKESYKGFVPGCPLLTLLLHVVLKESSRKVVYLCSLYRSRAFWVKRGQRREVGSLPWILRQDSPSLDVALDRAGRGLFSACHRVDCAGAE